MRWQGERESDNVEDRRGGRAMKVGVGGGLGMMVLLLVYVLLGGDPRRFLQNLPQEGQVTDNGGAGPAEPYQETPKEAELRKFVSVVLAETEDTWTEVFRGMGRPYEKPKLVLFTEAVQSACGFAQAAVGPFYCPENQKVYIDLSFYQELKERFGAPGDFAQAYVVAHEVGHHVQNLLGISDRARQLQEQGSEEEANAVSVRLELQADCLAGIWANHTEQRRHVLEPGDVEEALRAASAIGDDKIQMQSRGYVSPDSFTHGSSEQRVRWFRRGIESGDLKSCDTFASRSL